MSAKVMKRFPDYESLVTAKLMLPHEVERLKKCDDTTPHETTWTPILWATKLLTRARSEGKIKIESLLFNPPRRKVKKIYICSRPHITDK